MYPYDTLYKPISNVPIVSGATAYDDPDTGYTWLLVINEGLFYGNKLDHTLINPNQIRHYQIDYWDNPYDRMHDLSIVIPGVLTIPMFQIGTKLQFQTRSPTTEELTNITDEFRIELTSAQEWNPDSVQLSSTSIQIQDMPFCQTTLNGDRIYREPSSDEALLHSISPSFITLQELCVSQVQQRFPNRNISSSQQVDVPARRTFVSNKRHKALSAESIAELWGIGPKRAQATLDATTQRGTRSAVLPIARRYRADKMYNVKRLNCKLSCDTIWSDIRSLLQNICTQVYTHKCGLAVPYPLPRANGEMVGQSLQNFIHEYGCPAHLTFDGAAVQAGQNTLFMKTLRKYECKYHISSPRRPNENPSEGSIREIKFRWYRIMSKMQVPRRLWDFGFIWVCETGNISVSSSKYAAGRTPVEIITGETPDISEYTDFGFYDWITFKQNAGLGEIQLGRWLGVSHKVGQLMSYWVLPISGIPISCVTVQRLTNLEQETQAWQSKMSEFTLSITKRLDIRNPNVPEFASVGESNKKLSVLYDEEFLTEYATMINDPNIIEQDCIEHTSDEYINMQLSLPRGKNGTMEFATVKQRATDINNLPLGTPNKWTALDTRQYQVEYLDGTLETISANIIAENIMSQVDSDGHRQCLLDEIIDHRNDATALSAGTNMYHDINGIPQQKYTTIGHQVCAQWEDGSSNWVALKDMKNSYPIELAEYATRVKIDHLPAYSWWVPYTLKKQTRILAKLKSKYWMRSHKYGCEIPKSIADAKRIDAANKNRLWQDAIDLEMKNVRIAFQLFNGDPTTLKGYKSVTTHLIFDIKMGENFRRKVRCVGDGHKIDTPSSITYSSVVARDSVRICLLIAALNELDIKCADIMNAYLTAPIKEKFYTWAGPEFGQDTGKPFIIVRALYGLKSSGASFRSFLAEHLDDIGFRSTIADPDVWRRPAIKSCGERYYEYCLTYVDDILVVSFDPPRTMKQINEKFAFKGDKWDDTDIYLGAKITKRMHNGKNIWTMTSQEYLKAAIKEVENKNGKLDSKATTPIAKSYSPELDSTDELKSHEITYYQELIGILRWATEIGRVDILHEISILSAYQASPRHGHLKQLLHIFAYLKTKPKLTLYFDPDLPNIDYSTFQTNNDDFKEYYRDAVEEDPPRMPIPQGRSVKITVFVDASHGANKVTRRSHTGYIIFLNRAPIMWFSKKQNTVETSTFSSELIALRACLEGIISLRYKLKMFGVAIDGQADVLCDNLSVVKNTSMVDSKLHKKHNSLAFHAVRWAVAANILRVGKVDTKENISDPLTKLLTATERDYLFGNWTY